MADEEKNKDLEEEKKKQEEIALDTPPKDKEREEEKGALESEPKPTHRESFLEHYRKANPDFEGDPDDEHLWEHAIGTVSERDDYKGRYDELNGANEKLAEIVASEPRVAHFISMISNGEDPLFAIGKAFGNLIDELDEESLEKLRKGQAEYKERYNKVSNNFSTYEKTLKEYGEENGLTEENLKEIDDAICDMADSLIEGNIPKEVIDNVWKGLDYDSEKEAELEAVKLAERNKTIEEMKDKKKKSPLPDIQSKKTAPKVPFKFKEEEKPKTLADAIVEKED